MAQQPGTGQWDTGVPRWKSETPGVSLLAALAFYYFSCLLCLPFGVWFHLFSFPEGLGLSDITAPCISAGLWMAPLLTLCRSMSSHFLHWLEENQVSGFLLSLLASPFNSSPWEMAKKYK